MKNHLPLRIVCGFICAYCVCLGISLNCGNALVSRLALQLLEYEIPAASPLFLAAGMIGAYLAFFGLCMGLVAWQPLQHRGLLSAGAVLLLFRALQRIIHFQALRETFGLSSGRNTIYVVTVTVLAAALILFRLQLLKERKRSPLY